MNIIVNNYNNLKDEDITDITIKVKALMLNSNEEILLASVGNEYHFPGGKKEIQEGIDETIKREIKEETGINVSNMDLEPFAKLTMYFQDTPKKDRNKKVIIYYYEIFTNEVPNHDKMTLTENELKKNFKIIKVKFEDLKEILINNAIRHGDKKGIVEEMLQILDLYNKEGKWIKYI